jgi:hypothetical protein
MTLYKGNAEYAEVLGTECFVCGEEPSVNKDWIWYSGRNRLALCEYCAPVFIARIANDIAKTYHYDTLRIQETPSARFFGHAKTKESFRQRHADYLEALLRLIKEANPEIL